METLVTKKPPLWGETEGIRLAFCLLITFLNFVINCYSYRKIAGVLSRLSPRTLLC